MNAQQTKEFAVANGFELGRNGKRVTAKHLATGWESERGGYEALYNEMARVLDQYKRGIISAPPKEPGVNSNHRKIDERAALDADAAQWAAKTKHETDTFCAKNMLRIRELSKQELRTMLAIATGYDVDAIAAAFNINARLSGQTDAAYRTEVEAALFPQAPVMVQKSVDDLFNSLQRVRSKAAEIRKRNKPTHTVMIWLGEQDCVFFDTFGRQDAVKIVRRWLSGPDAKRVVRAEIVT